MVGSRYISESTTLQALGSRLAAQRLAINLDWTAQHQMTLNGKRDGFTLADFKACAVAAGLKREPDQTMLDDVCEAVARWTEFAKQAAVDDAQTRQIARAHRLRFA